MSFASARALGAWAAVLAAVCACDNSHDVQVELHMMGKCPFGNHMAEELSHALQPFTDDVDLTVSHIGKKSEDGRLQSLRGADELQADTLQACAGALGNQTSQRAFLQCQAGQYQRLPKGWQQCAESAGLEVAAMRKCAEGSQGAELLEASFARAAAKKVEESPTLFIQGKRYEGARNRYALMDAICAAMGSEPAEACSKRPKPTPVAVRVVTDKRCKEDCDLSAFQTLLDHQVPGAQVEVLDFGSDEGRKLYEVAGARHLPVAVFPADWNPGPVLGKQLAPQLQPLQDGKGLYLTLGHAFHPLAEVCDNGTDDDGDGQLDCDDAECVYRLQCREAVPNRVDIFLLMGDEFGHRAVEAAHHALAKAQFDVHLHPIGHTAEGGLVASGGTQALREGARLVCAQAHGLKGDELLTYAMCRQQRKADPNWQGCLPAEIERPNVQQCVEGKEGIGLLTQAYRASEQLQITRSPFVLLNNSLPLERYAPKNLVAALCKHNPGSKGCSGDEGAP